MVDEPRKQPIINIIFPKKDQEMKGGSILKRANVVADGGKHAPGPIKVRILKDGDTYTSSSLAVEAIIENGNEASAPQDDGSLEKR